jgi:hypothetical protein
MIFFGNTLYPAKDSVISLGTDALRWSGITTSGLQLDNGTQGVGKVLTSDIDGNASWTTASGGSFTEELDSMSSGTLATGASYEFEVDVDDGEFLIDAIHVMADTSTNYLLSTFTIEVYQTNQNYLDTVGTHARQGVYNLIYVEEDISIVSTRIDGGTESAGQTSITLDTSAYMVKYDPLYFAEDADKWYRVKSVTDGNTVVIYDDLDADKSENSNVWQVYEKKNLGMFYNQSSASTLYVRITNNSGGYSRFVLFTKITHL